MYANFVIRNIMKRTRIFGLIALAGLGALSLGGCKTSSSTNPNGDWIRRSTLDGVARSFATCFTINDTAFVGNGFDGQNRLSDFWKYDPDLNAWIQIADFPGTPRTSAVGFGANGEGFVTTGFDGTNYLNDTWMYDPVTNSWIQKGNFAGSGRYGAVAWGLGGKGYVATGYNGNYLKDFWQYDPATDQWTQKTSYGGSKRIYAMGFVINNMAYLVGGMDNGALVSDFWAYDPTADVWVQKRAIANVSTQTYDDNYTSIERQQGVAFVVGDSAYLATGQGASLTNTVWQYDPKADLWIPRNNFQASTRIGGIGFTVKGRGFVGLGTPSPGSLIEFDDLHEFDPYIPLNANDDAP